MNENLTNEVVEEVVETAMTKNKSGKAVWIGIGMLVGAGLAAVGRKIGKKIREKKMITVEATTEEPEEENSTEE